MQKLVFLIEFKTPSLMLHWAKGKTFSDAMNRLPFRPTAQESYKLYIYRAESTNDVSFLEAGHHFIYNDAKLIYCNDEIFS